MVSYSEIESNRFGLNIYRGKYESFVIDEIEEVVKDGNFDVIIVRFPSSTIYEHCRLLELPFCKVIHADSLLYYKASLQKIDIHPLRNNLIFEKITADTDGNLDLICKDIFNGYQNHYYSNPYLDRSKIIEGYIEWAKSYVSISEGRVAWFARDYETHDIKAFITCAFFEKESLADLILGGVLPKYVGGGIYTDLVRHCQLYFREKGLKTLQTSTQLQNYRVQIAWNKEGFSLDNTWETYHLINLKHIDKICGKQ